METLLSDIVYGFRLLVSKPTFSIVAVLTLAVGIGANTAIFSVFQGVVLAPLPFPEPEELVMVWQDHSRIEGPATEWASPDNFFDWREQNEVFDGVAAIAGWGPTLSGVGAPEQLAGARISHDAIPLLGLAPVVGRAFTDAEQVANGPAVVLLSHELWQTRFEGRRDVVGEAVILDGQPATVVGVLPAAATFPVVGAPDVVSPLQIDRSNSCGRGCVTLRVVARLADGVDSERARAEMSAIAARMERQFPDDNRGVGVNLVPLHDDVVGSVRPALVLLVFAVGLVLLIACANVASLMLARAADCGREVATRLAIGASRTRLVRQMLTESLVLAALSTALGLLVALWGVALLQSLVPAGVPRFADVQVDARALLFTAVLGAGTALLFGLAPALRATRPSLQGSLGTSRAGTRPESVRFRSLLVVAEIAVAMTLLIGASLLLRSFGALLDVDTGFETERVLTAGVALVGPDYDEETARIAFFDRLLERTSALPGVEHAGAISALPMSGRDSDAGFRVEGRAPPSPGQEPVAWYRPVTPSYFDTMKVRLVSGRRLEPSDDAKAPPVVLINEAAAARYWNGEDPLLSSVRIGGASRRVVGIVSDTKHFGLDTGARPAMYFPYAQLPTRFMSLVVATSTPAGTEAAAAPLRAVISELDPTLALANVVTMEELVERTVAGPRLTTTLLAIFAAVALTLAAVGLYGILSHTVRSRTHEIGLRMALGASASDVLGRALASGLGLVAIGGAIGLLGALALTRSIDSLLFGVAGTDPWTFVVVPLVLGSVALAACYLPARRAARVDPITALRYE